MWQLYQQENAVIIEDSGKPGIGGRWSIVCHLSQEVCDHLPLVDRRSTLVKAILEVCEKIFRSDLFRHVPRLAITFTERGPQFELDWTTGGCLNPDYFWAGDYRCGNIDRDDEAYLLYICLQLTIHLIEADIVSTKREGLELSDKPVEPLSYVLERKRPRRGK